MLHAGLITLAMAASTILLLQRLRELILYRRSRANVWIWRWMVGLFVFLAALDVFAEFYSKHWMLYAMWIGASIAVVVLAAFNAFRMSWVVRLSANQKVRMIFLALALLAACGLVFSDLLETLFSGRGFNSNPIRLAEFYSIGMHGFIRYAIGFGAVYCLISVLSLAFHLPTTRDYRRRDQAMAAMYSLADLVKESIDQDKLAQTVVSSVAEAHTATAWLALPDPESGLVRARVVAAHNISPAAVESKVQVNAFYEEIASTREKVHLAEALTDRRVLARSADGIKSLLALPLLAHERLLGVLFVGIGTAHGFEQEDIQGIGSLAAQAALALDNARLFQEQVERERMARELAIAREMQERLLPQSVPEFEHIEVAASSVSAYEVGGDYHDFLELDGHRLAFIVSDVSGKGTSAAFYMANMHGVFRSVTRIAPEPREFLRHANQVLYETMERSVFITIIYGIVDCDHHTITLARAGHCPAILARGTEPAMFLRSSGLGVGLDRGKRFEDSLAVETVTMTFGDAAVFYTDGVVESRNPSGEEYGYERLLAAVESCRDKSATALHAALLEDLRQFMGSTRSYDDDMTLLVFKWHESEPSQPAIP